VDLSREFVSTIPPADIHLYEHDTNTQSTSLVDSESFTAMLNSHWQEDDSSCGNLNESAGGSFFALRTKLHSPKLSVPVGPSLFPDMPVDYDHGHHPMIDSANASQSMATNSMEFNFGSESGFNFDFNEFDFTNTDNFDFENMDVDALGLGNLDVATFDYKQAFTEAALSIGVQENRSDNFPADSSRLILPPGPYPYHPNVNTMSTIGTSAGLSSPVLSSTSGVLSAPTLPEPDGIYAHHRPTKRKKVDEVNAAHILPEGLQRSRTKSAKAVAALGST
jgi:hypothetical protein